MKKRTQNRLAWVAVVGVMVLSVAIGILPNLALLGASDMRVAWLGIIMIASIPIMEIAVALLAYHVLSHAHWRPTKRLALACITLVLALIWNGYNVKRGLDMAPNALSAQSASLAASAAAARQHAQDLRGAKLRAQQAGQYVNSREMDRAISRAEREALNAETRAATQQPPASWMLLILTAAMKAIELTLLYIVSDRAVIARNRASARGQNKPRPAPAATPKPTVAVDNTSAEEAHRYWAKIT